MRKIGTALICMLFIVIIVEVLFNNYLNQRVTALTNTLWDYEGREKWHKVERAQCDVEQARQNEVIGYLGALTGYYDTLDQGATVAMGNETISIAELRARAEFFAASKFIEGVGVEEAKIALEGLVDADYLDAIAKTIADTKTAKRVEMAEYGSSRISSDQSGR